MWKEIPETDGLYFANELGQIKSSDRPRFYKNGYGTEGYYMRKGKVLNPVLNSHGYPCVTIKYLNGKQKIVTVHILIAKTFIPNPGGKPQVNHIDGNKKNNSVSNLEWVTASENLKHAFRTGLNPGSSPWTGKRGKAHNRSIPVIMCDLQGNEIREFGSMHLASEATGANWSHIGDCIKGRRKTCAGYRWKAASTF